MPAHVLVVDDDPASVEVLKAKLEAEYFRVSTAADGKTALALMHEDCPDIVLLDVMMPAWTAARSAGRSGRHPRSPTSR